MYSTFLDHAMYGIVVRLILRSGFVLVAFGVAILGQWASYRRNLGLLPRAVRLRSFWLVLICGVQLSAFRCRRLLAPAF